MGYLSRAVTGMHLSQRRASPYRNARLRAQEHLGAAADGKRSLGQHLPGGWCRTARQASAITEYPGWDFPECIPYCA